MKNNIDLTLKRHNVKLGSNFGSRLNMKMEKKRATIYFDPDLFNALRLKAAATEESISNLVNEAIRFSLREDEKDLRSFEERANEPLISFEEVLKKLRQDGKL